MGVKNKWDKKKIFDLVRLILAFCLTIPLIIEHILMFFDLQQHEWKNIFEWYSLFATVIVQFGFGYQFYIYAYEEVFKYKKIGMSTLIVLSSTISFIWSLGLFATLQSGNNLDFNNDMHSDYLSFFEVGASITAFALLGEYVSDFLHKNVNNDIHALIKLQVDKAFLYNQKTKQTIEINASEIKIGDLLLVRNNHKIPVDGKLISKSSYVNETILTGEAKPVYKTKNNELFAGTINLGHNIIIQANVHNNDTVLSSIINKVNEIQDAKPDIQKIVDKIAKWFTPMVLVLASVAFVINFFFGYDIQQFLKVNEWTVVPHFAEQNTLNYVTINILSSIFFSIAMIAIACPCALGLATPLAIAIGLGVASKNNIVFNTKEIFEKIKNINAIAFDKTGTLTIGKLQVVHSTDKQFKYKDIVYTLESQSIHPLADSLVNYLARHEASLLKFKNLKEEIGFGIKATIDNHVYVISSKQKLLEQNYKLSVKQSVKKDDATEIALTKDNDIVAIYQLKDKLNPNAKEVIRYLHKNNIETYIITGDNESNAIAIAKQTGIKKYFANVKPEQKGKIIEEIQSQNKSVAYVGDGINDLIALKQSNLAISISITNESAKDVSDLNIANGDIMNIYKAIKITKLTRRAIIYNIIWAFAYNSITIPLAFFGIVPMIVAPIAMGFSDVSLILNTLFYRELMKRNVKKLIKY